MDQILLQIEDQRETLERRLSILVSRGVAPSVDEVAELARLIRSNHSVESRLYDGITLGEKDRTLVEPALRQHRDLERRLLRLEMEPTYAGLLDLHDRLATHFAYEDQEVLPVLRMHAGSRFNLGPLGLPRRL